MVAVSQSFSVEKILARGSRAYTATETERYWKEGEPSLAYSLAYKSTGDVGMHYIRRYTLDRLVPGFGM